MSAITLSIDGQKVRAEQGVTVLEAARQHGMYIPTLCAHPNLPPFGGCRMCVVEIEGMRGFPTSCTTPVAEGMNVWSNTKPVNELRRGALELILAEHPHECLVCHRRKRCSPYDVCLRTVGVEERCVMCPENEQCELQRVVDYMGGYEMASIPFMSRNQPIHRDSPYFERNYNLCILCGRCVRACGDMRGIHAIDFTHRGHNALIGTAFNRPLKDSNCRFCYSCVEVCPTGALVDYAERWKPLENRDGHVVPCRNACPARVDAARYVRLIADGKPADALAVVREKVPFPGTLGRVCIHPCEQNCRHEKLKDPIAIKFLKRYAADRDNGLWKQGQMRNPSTGKRVAVVGGGPSGLTAAFYLAKKGHSVTVFEALPEPGGMMRVGIPEYRLPRNILKGEIDEILAVGVKILTGARVESLDPLFKEGFQAVYVAVGAHQGMKMGVEGENTPGVMEGVTFLREVALGKKVTVGNRVAVVGGGNAAIDAARVALRIGATEVSLIYRRTREEMPASPEEVDEALHEGVKIVYLAAPSKISKGANGLQMECTRMKLGKPDASGRRSPEPIPGGQYTMEFDTIIAGIGQRPDVPVGFGLKLGRGNTISANAETMETERKGVYAGGDVVSGPASVIQSIAHGRSAASAIDKMLGGDGVIDEVLAPVEEPNPVLGRWEEGIVNAPVGKIPAIALAERLKGFTEVETGYTDEQAVCEADRCLRCHLRLEIACPSLPPAGQKITV